MKIDELLEFENEKFSKVRINKVLGALFGFAIGDAMGATTEFMTREEITEKYGKFENIQGGGWLDLKAGEVTDDTQMSICVMNALMKNDIAKFKENVVREFVKWFETKPKDVGLQCSKAISHYITTGEYISVDNDALGNGTLMRALPCALLNTKEGDVLNVVQGEITHNNKKCEDIILEYSKIIQNYINEIDFELEKRDLLEPLGYVVNTYNNAIYWAKSESVEDGIVGAVNHGGDADTVAAITGSILGAKFGYNSIPTRWIEQLSDEVKEKLTEFMEFLVSDNKKEEINIMEMIKSEKVEWKKLEDLIEYEQPTKYIVKSTNYNDSFSTPVLTAGQTFILGYTNEENGVYNCDKNSPVIIFDDFTAGNHWVDFDFKVKSSAMKILKPKNKYTNLRYCYHYIKTINFDVSEHKRIWISKFSQIQIPIPSLNCNNKLAT